MKVRRAEEADKEEILRVIRTACDFMRSTGNRYQWDGTDYPGTKVDGDIKNGTGFVVANEGKIAGYFAYITGEDPTYRVIDGQWLMPEVPYGTIHRVASDGSCKGILEVILNFVSTKTGNIRIDTHEANAPMRHKLEKNGFTYCGIITVEDGSERRAYQRIKGL